MEDKLVVLKRGEHVLTDAGKKAALSAKRMSGAGAGRKCWYGCIAEKTTTVPWFVPPVPNGVKNERSACAAAVPRGTTSPLKEESKSSFWGAYRTTSFTKGLKWYGNPMKDENEKMEMRDIEGATRNV